jgi:hypothetical protein
VVKVYGKKIVKFCLDCIYWEKEYVGGAEAETCFIDPQTNDRAGTWPACDRFETRLIRKPDPTKIPSGPDNFPFKAPIVER